MAMEKYKNCHSSEFLATLSAKIILHFLQGAPIHTSIHPELFRPVIYNQVIPVADMPVLRQLSAMHCQAYFTCKPVVKEITAQ